MPFSDFLGDKENDKFGVDFDGNTCVRVLPGAITDAEDGNQLDIDDFGRARMLDTKAVDMLSCISDQLAEVVFQLKLITGA